MKPQHGRMTERRKHPRFPVVEGLIEPINLQFDGPKGAGALESPKPALESQPAILTNLSAGGMSLLTFVEPPRAKAFVLKIGLAGINIPVEGRVVRINAKGQTFNVGIQFTRIAKKHRKQISDMAADHSDCETRISLTLPEACVPDCRFHWLCHKPQKAPHWPRKA